METVTISLISAVVAYLLQVCNKKMKNEEGDNMEYLKISVLVATIVFIALNYNKTNSEAILTESFEN
tara:strand:- start:1643 stop:1843 length:201 start_codon:yes stop_codon:yes gene_type:complete